MNPLLKGLRSTTRPRDREPPWKWCEKYVYVDPTSPMPGRWRSDNSPWVREVLDQFANSTVTDITVKCSAQSSKTQTIMCGACWVISEAAGPAQWVMATRDDAKIFVRDRMKPTFENCEPVSAKIRGDNLLEWEFTDMPFYFVGAGSRSKLQSKPIRWLFLDEVRNYLPGALPMVLKRTRAFWNCKRFMISTPNLKGDPIDLAFMQGDQRTWHFPCPNCNEFQMLRFEQLKWDTNERTKPDGIWNLDALAETIRYECMHCGHAIKDTPAERKHITRAGKFIPLNPGAPKHRVSFHWNALLPTWVRWVSIVEEYLNARAAMREGDIEPFKTFVNETLGESWSDELGAIEDYGYLEMRKADYDYGEPWAEEVARYMAADRQASGGEHYWWVVRAFGRFGKSRLIAYGKCNSTLELEQTRVAYSVERGNAMIDSGFKASEVYQFCVSTGWKAFKGDDADYFLTRDERTKKTVRKPFNRTFVDPMLGKGGRSVRPLPLFRWSNSWVKDTLAAFTTGLVGEWTLPRRISREYLKQMTAEKRSELVDSRGRIRQVWKQVRRDNHLLDCELMIMVAAIINNHVTASQVIRDA